VLALSDKPWVSKSAAGAAGLLSSVLSCFWLQVQL
jgi:hypothetical protein